MIIYSRNTYDKGLIKLALRGNQSSEESEKFSALISVKSPVEGDAKYCLSFTWPLGKKRFMKLSNDSFSA